MVFNSYLFLLVFLPLLLAGWFVLNHRGHFRLAEYFMTCMSAWFYGMFGLWPLLIIFGTILWNYMISLAADRLQRRAAAAQESTAQQQTGVQAAAAQTPLAGKQQAAAARRLRLLMAAGICGNLLVLAVFKYLPVVSDKAGFALPVGLSFYVFSQISFVIDRCRGEIAHDGFGNYVLYVMFFPKLAEGPITMYDEIMRQFRDPERRRFQPENFTRGWILLTLGLGKKLLLADNLAAAASYGFSAAYYSDFLTGILAICSYAFQLYMDFSGFCDMGMGIGWMLNIELPVNFDAPYKTVSFGKFWQKWHMTLTRFFTKYVYIPLGGSRKGRARTVLNIMIVFLLSALWHGASVNYLIWGVLSGALVAAYHLWSHRRKPAPAVRYGDAKAAGNSTSEKSSPAASKTVAQAAERSAAAGTAAKAAGARVLTFGLFCFTLVFFGAQRPDLSLAFLRCMKYLRFPGNLLRLSGNISLPELFVVDKAASMLSPQLAQYVKLAELAALLAVCVVLVNGRRCAREIAKTLRLSRRNGILLGLLFAWCMISMTGVSTYLYFKF